MIGPVFRAMVLAGAILAVLAYLVASRDLSLGVLVLPLVAAGWWVTRGGRGRRVPKVLGWLMVTATIGYVLIAIRSEGISVNVLSRFVATLLVVKSFDRRGIRDHAQILALSLFLSLAALVTDVVLLPSLLVGLSFLAIASGVILMQFESADEHLVIARRARRREGPALDPAGWRWLGGVTVLLAMGSMVVGGVLFVLVPRGVGSTTGASTPTLGARDRSVDFTDEVDLGRGGTIQTDESIVMRVELLDDTRVFATAPPFIYLRGAALERYAQGTWARGNESLERGQTAVIDEGRPFVVQGGGFGRSYRITHQDGPRGRREMFTPENTIAISSRTRREIEYDPAGQTFVAEGTGAPMVYTAAVLASGEQVRVRPVSMGSPNMVDPRIREIAASVLQNADIEVPEAWDEASARQAASAFRTYLHLNFAYSLDQPAVPLREDPTAWFLENASAGHCEYFASAMTQLCWAVGLDARVVTGYLAAEFNPSANAYTVRRSNAHAWSEVHIPGAGWQRFDATPSGDLRQIHQPEPTTALWVRHLLDAAEAAWISAIVAFDERRQTQVLGVDFDAATRPLAALDGHVGSMTVGVAARSLGLGILVFSCTAGVGLGLVLWWERRQRRRAHREIWPTAMGRSIYQRLLKHMARRGRPKPIATPLRHHAERFRETADLLPIVESLYEARFGASERALRRAQELLAAIDTGRSRTPKPS